MLLLRVSVYCLTNKKFKNKLALKVSSVERKTNHNEIEYFKIFSQIKEIQNNIPKLYYIFSCPDYIYIIMDCYENGCMSHHLISEKLVDFKKMVKIIKSCVLTLDAIHKNGYVLNDLKPENLLLDKNYNPIFIDFGFAGKYNDEYKFMYGTPVFQPPELLQYRLTNDRYFISNNKKDIWALGILFLEIFTGENYFEEIMNDKSMDAILYKENLIHVFLKMKKILYNLPPSYISRKYLHHLDTFIFSCLEPDFNKRPSAEDLLSFSLFK